MAIITVCIIALLVLAIQRKLYARYWKAGLRVSLGFSERVITEGEEVLLTETIENRKFLPLPWLAVKFSVSGNLEFLDHMNVQTSDYTYRNDLFNVMMNQRIKRRLPVKGLRRGYYTIKSLDLVSSDVVATLKLTEQMGSNAALTIYPRIISAEDFIVPYNKILGTILARRFINPDPFEFKGIREYQPYDSLKSINFKATAKANKFMVNINDYTLSQEIVIILNLEPYSAYPSEYLYEDAIRMAASLAAYYAREGIPLSFYSGGYEVESGSGGGHMENIMESLAHIDLNETHPPAAPIIESELSAGRADPVYVLISTYRGKDLTDAFARLRESGAATVWIVPLYADMDLSLPDEDNMTRWVVNGND